MPRQASKAFLAIFLSIPLLGACPALCGEHASPVINASQAQCQRSNFRVVIDVGHTVAVPGATSARGVPEYAFNLRLAEDAYQALVDAGFDKSVLLITSKAPLLGLFERTMRANNLPADLFISIHHDSVPDYLLQTWEYDGQQHHFNDSFPGYALFVSNANGDRAGSLSFGRFLGAELQARGLGYTPHYTLALMRNRRRELLDPDAGVYRYDDLVVLQQTHMAAVLLEAGSIVNRREELELANPERRKLISSAITAAVENFCTERANRHSEHLVKRPSAPAAAAQPHRANTIFFLGAKGGQPTVPTE